MDEHRGSFIWDSEKERLNIAKHGVDFIAASVIFRDPNIEIAIDHRHSLNEVRYYGVGKVGHRILTVRFLYRAGRIRIIGAGYWRKGERLYDKSKKEKSN